MFRMVGPSRRPSGLKETIADVESPKDRWVISQSQGMRWQAGLRLRFINEFINKAETILQNYSKRL